MIIGVCGFINSGKGTVADLLVKDHGYTKMSFADALKDSVAAIFGWPRYLLEGDTEASRKFRETEDEFWSQSFGYTVTPRLMLQKVGTEAMRVGLHEDVWITALERRICAQPSKKKIVIPDTRFPNEIAMIRRRGGKVIRVARGPEPIWYNLALKANADDVGNGLAELLLEENGIHPSEYKWIGTDFDAGIANEGTLEDLTTNVNYIVKRFEGA